MNKVFKISSQDIFPISVILLLAFTRLIPHPPNFTPIIAVAIMSGCFFKNVNKSFIILLIAMLLADVFIGFYANMLFVYFSLFLITFIFFKISNKINIKNLFIYGFFGSLIFYLLSNFGVWLVTDLYSKDFQGLINCYLLAIPFFKNTLFSTIIFSYVAFISNYFYSKNKIKNI